MLSPETMMKSQSGMLLKVMTGSMALQYQESVLISVAHISTKGHVTVPGLG